MIFHHSRRWPTFSQGFILFTELIYKDLDVREASCDCAAADCNHVRACNQSSGPDRQNDIIKCSVWGPGQSLAVCAQLLGLSSAVLK
jgi:hypothetical protein